jgi:hypothetical protein
MEVVVRHIVDKRHPPSFEVLAEFTPAAVEQRSNDVPVARVHAGESARAGTPHKPEQKRFRLVVAGMPQGHDIGTEVTPSPREELVPGRARGVLERSPLETRPRQDILTIGEEGPRPRAGHFTAELLFLAGGRSELVVEVGDSGNRELVRQVQLPHEAGQGNRIRTTRERHDDARIGSGECVAPNGPADSIDQFH